jgi:hypothetical protein
MWSRSSGQRPDTAAPLSELHLSKKSTFRERHAAVVRYDQVIEDADIHQLQRLA